MYRRHGCDIILNVQGNFVEVRFWGFKQSQGNIKAFVTAAPKNLTHRHVSSSVESSVEEALGQIRVGAENDY